MKIAYNAANGRVFRLLRDDYEAYAPGFAVAFVDVAVEGNKQLLLALHNRPSQFVYDGSKFIEDGETEWEIDTKHSDSAGEFGTQIPSLAQALAAVDAVGDMADAKAVLAKMVRAIYALARRTGVS